MKYLIIFLVLIGFTGTVFAVPEPLPEDDFRYSDHVVTGKIISSEIILDPREDNSAATFYDTIIYKVKVEKWHKNPLADDIITVYGTHFPNDVIPEPNWGVLEFEIGDTVYLYIDKTDEGLKFREYGSKLLYSKDSGKTEITLSPLKQMQLGIKLAHIICDKDKFAVWNIHLKPACVYPDTESELLTRGWAKLRLMLPAGPDPIKELEITGQNEFSYRVMGNLVYGDEKYPLSEDRKREIAWEYSQQYHPEENYLEYAIISHEKHHNVGDKIQFDLLEWGNYQNCWNLKLQILDIYDHSIYEDNSVKYCLEPDGVFGTFHSYSMGNEFDEFVCKNPGYYRIEVSNGIIHPSKILENFVCMEPENEN
jgi:hypothetical protein